ncbi:MAG TPA: acyl carrier protein [Thermoflexia bacterium]|jgi:acyl carrier protein|nr:acyl carrier protein [Thermoflexia bacterium]
MPKITFEEFRRIIAEELDVDENLVVPEASFVEDLMADSIQLVEMMLRLEELGVSIPMEKAWQVRTVGDAYRLYTEK